MPIMTVGTGRSLIYSGSYNDLVLGTGPIAYWPQSESAGTTAYCLVNPAQNGTYTGVTLANDNTGPFGTPAPFYDGATSYNNVFSAAFDAAFNGAEGSLMTWAKVNAAGVWTDAAQRYAAILFDDANNNAAQWKHTVNNEARMVYEAGAVVRRVDINPITYTTWMQWVITWSSAADEVRAYVNTAQQGATLNGLGVWGGGGLSPTQTCIGAGSTGPAAVWHGWVGPCGVWTRALTPAEVASLYVS